MGSHLWASVGLTGGLEVGADYMYTPDHHSMLAMVGCSLVWYGIVAWYGMLCQHFGVIITYAHIFFVSVQKHFKQSKMYFVAMQAMHFVDRFVTQSQFIQSLK